MQSFFTSDKKHFVTVMESPPITEDLYVAAFPNVAAWVRKMGGTLEEAKDIFHDALVLYQEKIDQGLLIESAPQAYIMGIVKHLWMRKFRRMPSTVSFEQHELDISIPQDFYPTVNDIKLLQFLEKAGKNCLELLRSMYYGKMSVSELAKRMGYRSEHSASVQKYKCIEKLRNTIRQKSLNYEDFLD